MKKLFYGLMVAMCAFAFSAFTTNVSTKQLPSLYYLGTDGNYHKMINSYDAALCLGAPPLQCAWQKVSSSGVPDTMSPALFNAFKASGYFTAYGSHGQYYGN